MKPDDLGRRKDRGLGLVLGVVLKDKKRVRSSDREERGIERAEKTFWEYRGDGILGREGGGQVSGKVGGMGADLADLQDQREQGA